MSTETSQNSYSGNSIDSQKKADSLFDLNRILFLLRKNWYLFLISFPICLGSVFMYHRYTVPVYQARATLLLKSGENQSVSKSDLIEGFGLSPEVRSVENQTFIIRSRKLIKKAIDRLDFGLSYYQEGMIKDTELYHNSPFVVEFDSLHPQLLNVPISIQFTSNGSVDLKVEAEGGRLYNYNKQSGAGGLSAINFAKQVKLNEWVTEKGFSFRIKGVSGQISPQNKYYVVFKSHNQLAGEYRGSLGVSPYREGSNIVFITSVGTNTEKIRRFLDELSIVILEHNLDRKNYMATRSLDFIEVQLKSIADTLDKVQNRLLNFRKNNRFMGPSEFSQKLAEQYFEADKELKMIEMQEGYYRYLQSNLETATDIEEFMLPAVDDENTGLVNQLVMQLITLEEEREMLTSAAESDNHYIKALETKIGVTSDNLKRAVNQVLKSYELERGKITRKMDGVVDDMDLLPDLEKSYLKIDRTYKLNDAIYTFLLQKHSETQIAKASNVPDNEIIDNASISAIVSPKSKSNYQKGFMLALLIPVGFIVLKEFLNTKVRGKDDVDYLVPNLPIMGMIIHSKSDAQNVIHDKPHSVISESFRAIRTKLKFMSSGAGAKIISLTSTNTGEGKTFCAQNLASVFSISGKKTVLLGFDLRKPRLTALFDLNGRDGLSNYLIGQCSIEDMIYETSYDNLFVIPAGPIPPNPSELISGDNTNTLFEYLRSNFDVVIVDSPPVGLVADARMLMQFSDNNLFVVRANYTLKEHMKLTVDNLIHDEVGNLGLIVNDVSLNEKSYGYYSAEYYDGSQYANS
ncbi:GumC family protein [Carboxylicivirga sp. N1Y90]|uniref:GumC family protein n=1 Tax=Carboxylicivirga fragile TaxID=3417571 RepID=UPI003D32D2D5|nr:polysaccharide biosynthesis tyrosine autokinase [Marinilabiliaceae bacterium N1Y90]